MRRIREMRDARTSGNDRDDRGAVIVESAIVITVLLVLFFGVLEFGMLLRSQHALAEATPTGARAASSLPRTDGYHTAAAEAVAASLQASIPSDAVLDLVIYKADPVTGSSNFNGCGSCYRFEWNRTTQQFDPITGQAWNFDDQKACGEVGTTHFVGVFVTGEYDFVITFWSDNVTLSDKPVMRLEPIIDSAVCS